MKKRVSYSTERELECLRYLSKCYDFALSLHISLAMNELYTAIAKLRDAGMYVREVKVNMNNAVKEGEMRRSAIMGYMASKGFFDSYTDRVIDLAEKDVSAFRDSIRGVMEKHDVKNANIYAQIEVARCLLQACVLDFRSVAADAKKKFNVDRSSDFKEYDMSGTHFWVEKATDVLYKNVDKAHGNIELRTPATARMFNRIHKKIADGEYIEECMKTANEEHPEFTSNEIAVS